LASRDAIAAVSQAVLGLLRDNYPRDPFEPLGFQLVHPAVYEDAAVARPNDTITLCLWRIVPNGTPRLRPPRQDATARRFRPSLPIDLHYLATPWATDVEKQQRLLGWLLRALADTAVLPAVELNRHLDVADVFAADEQVELILDAPPIVDFLALWDKLKPRLQSSAFYVARGLALDSEIVVPEGGAVRERRFGVGTMP